MKWCNLLHFYQPANQQKDILEAVVNQCYRPLFLGLLGKDRAKLTVNISGALFELLDMPGFTDVLTAIRDLHNSGKIEITSTACYHSFLPLLPDREVVRQVELNNRVLNKYLGSSFKPKGFFPPEMACTDRLMDIIGDMGFEYIVLDEIAGSNTEKLLEHGVSIFSYLRNGLNVFYRQRVPSNVLMSGIERHSSKIADLLHEYEHQRYLITAMDGETFGHHRPGLEVAFLELFDLKNIQCSTIYEIMNQDIPKVQISSIQDSTWASSIDDIVKGIQFISWRDSDNKIHSWQWELVQTMLAAVNNMGIKDPTYTEIRSRADKALASDQFFWACAKPWWSVEMIEGGAYDCLTVIEKIPNISQSVLDHARTLYRDIVSTAFEWQRSGKIREMSAQRNIAQRIPFKARTLEVGGVETAVYKAFIDMMRSQEAQASAYGEYEKAILWRDAVRKIETKNDIYDAVNAIDLLRVELTNEKVEQMLDEYTAEYRKIRGGQPEQRSN